jgi:putative Ca2+/H+ antiporter (TMEM165/GDT1 family)
MGGFPPTICQSRVISIHVICSFCIGPLKLLLFRRPGVRHDILLSISFDASLALPAYMPPIHDADSEEGVVQALLQAYSMIIFSEIGDKTFLIAAILAMRHPRIVVFAGAIGSLIVMSILSAVMGHVLPTLIPKQWTQFAAAFLFLVFGMRMLMEARQMKGGNEKMQEEMKEAEEEIKDDDAEHDGVHGTEDSIPLQDLEEAKGIPEETSRNSISPSPKTSKSGSSVGEGLRNFFSLFLGPVFVQAFILTFLGEWGDRSQIATIALGAAHVSGSERYFKPRFSHFFVESQNVYLVTLGTVVGHSCCTALAVIGGRYVSTKISVKHGTFRSCLNTLVPNCNL